jgi:anti-sigma regulatory factor (Ser/Thr protein kinase)
MPLTTSVARERPLENPAEPWAGVKWRVFPGEVIQVRELRRWLVAYLPDSAQRDDVILVASELASNAVLHTASGRGGSFAVELNLFREVIRVAVADGGERAGPMLADDVLGERGRGLLIVCGLAMRSGVSGDCRGRLVWAELPWSV